MIWAVSCNNFTVYPLSAIALFIGNVGSRGILDRLQLNYASIIYCLNTYICLLYVYIYLRFKLKLFIIYNRN